MATFLALCPSVALADVGTPLVWASGFYMFLGNAILGLLEGWLLAKVFKLKRGRCIGLLILANYFSAWLGMFIVDALRASQTVDIYNAQRVTLILVFVTYMLTLLFEWPFVAFCFRQAPHWFSRSIKASLLIQTVSYLLLFGGFWLVSDMSLYTHFSIVSPEDVSLPRGVSVYFISEGDGHVYRRSDRGERELVFELASTDTMDFLKLQESKTSPDLWDLVAVLDRRRSDDKTIVIVANVMTSPPESAWMTQQYWGWGSAPQIGTAANSTWRFSWGHWPTVGLYGSEKETGKDMRVSYGTPVMSWPVWRAIHLPENKVLFQLGDDQLCLFDVSTKCIGLWDRGHGPVAVSEEESSNTVLHSDTAKRR
ncbi:MAG: hypothetical protein JXQ75_04115 [Phycisphaerae bacterium]|nr:hypothetical protein [Phycisphaerae bacterium]